MSVSYAPRAETHVTPRTKHTRDLATLATIAFLCVGVGLRVMQYAANTSQWLDEVMLSWSVIHRAFLELLTRPLAYGQSAPPGFLAAQRLAIVLFGTSDLALRLVPSACSVGALFVYFRLAKLTLPGIGRPIAMALFATGAPLILYAGQAKQYSSDVAVAAILLLVVVQSWQAGIDRRRARLLALAGFVAVWFSNSAPLLLSGAALALLWPFASARAARQEEWSRLVPVAAIWAIASGASLWLARSNVSAAMRQTLVNYWSDGFMPMPPWRMAALVWPLQAFSRIFGGVESAGLWYPANRLYAVISLLGLASICRRDRRLGLLLIAPFLVTLLAATAHLYPFRDRLALFLLPSALLGLAEGIRVIAELAGRKIKLLAPAAVAVCMLPILYRSMSALPPYQSENIKPVLSHLRSQLQPSDTLYVYHGAGIAFAYYAQQFGVNRGHIVQGMCHYGDPRRHLEELDQLRGGARVWVLFTHSLPDYNEHQDLLGYLDTIGVRRAALSVPPHKPAGSFAWVAPVDLYLYDLSNPARLTGALATTFPVHPHNVTYTCN